MSGFAVLRNEPQSGSYRRFGKNEANRRSGALAQDGIGRF